MPGELRWESFGGPNSWAAYCADGIVGLVTKRFDGKFAWQITAVHMKWIGEGDGIVVTEMDGKRAVEQNWRLWLQRFGFEK